MLLNSAMNLGKAALRRPFVADEEVQTDLKNIMHVTDSNMVSYPNMSFLFEISN